MQEQIQQVSLWILPILIAIVFHEVAHGYVAHWCGDDTAKRAGRLTLNPIPHIDPIGSVIVPVLLLVLSSGFLFGWAKPVPVNFSALGNPRRDMVLVAAAGPGVNLLIALASALLFHAIMKAAPDLPDAVASTVLFPIALMAKASILMNVFLGIFNLVPIPPLDGGRVLAGLLPIGWAQQFARIEPFGFMILVLLLMTHSLSAVLEHPMRLLLGVLLP